MTTLSSLTHPRSRRVLLILIAVYAVFGGASFSFFHEFVKEAFFTPTLSSHWTYLFDIAYIVLTVVLIALLLYHTLQLIQGYEHALQESEERFRSLVNSMDDVVFTMNRELRLTGVYGQARMLEDALSVEYLGRSVWELYPAEVAALHESASSRALRGEYVTYEWGATLPVTPAYYSTSVSPLRDVQGEIIGLVGVSRNITDRKQVEFALEQAAREWRATFDAMHDSVALLSPEGVIIRANRATARMLDKSFTDIIGQPFDHLLHRSALPQDDCPFLRMRQSGQRETGVFPWQDRWYAVTVDPLLNEDGIFSGAIHTMSDITERKHAEEQIGHYQEQLVSLASELSLVEERERRRIATGLHDCISQALAISNIKLGLFRESVLASPEQSAAIDEVRELIYRAYEDCQSLTFELSPPMLYELGLPAALEWLGEQMQERHDVAIQVESDGPFAALSEEMRALLFRAVRELLINIVKHARAENARIMLRQAGGCYEILVEDNGIGFDPVILDGHAEGCSGFGLFSIRERLRHFAGRVEVTSAPGRGTRVTLTLPCPQPAALELR